nr:DedA family protein [Ktedonobacterales bacterium]
SAVPLPLLYVIVAVWVGVESAGVGVPIEPMMLFVGSLAARGQVNVALAIIATATGCLAFAGLAYVIGRRTGTTAVTRAGRFIGLNQTRADHIELWLRNRGAAGVLIARVTPMVRTFGSYIMGAADIAPITFALGTLAGSLVYCGLWIILGNLLGDNYAAPLRYLDRVGAPGIAAVAGVILLYIVLHHLFGRFTLHRIALHFRRHHAALAATTATASRAR